MRFRWLALVILALGVFVARGTHNWGRGESSIRLPEIREAAPPSRIVVRSSVWARDADVPDETILAAGSGAVAFTSDGRLCSFAETTGATNWCRGVGHDPVYAGGVVAYTGEDGAIDGVDARTGKHRWRFSFPTSARGRELPGPRLSPRHRAWSTGAGFLIFRSDGRSGYGAPNYGEVSPAGRLFWSAQEIGAHGEVIVTPPFVLQRTTATGARIVIAQNVIRPGRGVIARIDDARAVIDTRHGRLTAAVDTVEPVEDRFLVLNVATYELATGRVLGAFGYKPDYDENDQRYGAGRLDTLSSDELGHGEDDVIYPYIGGNLYRYALGPPQAQHPILLATGRSYFGGPYHGLVYVERFDGVWSLRADERAVHARLVAPSGARPTTFTAAEGNVYVGFADGTVRGVDGATGRTILAARACPPSEISVTSERVYVACRGRPRWRILAYPRETRSEALPTVSRR
jgi:outer membrane protein assembly factor BamB